MSVVQAGKSFGPYQFIGSDADSSDTTYANDTWTFSNLCAARNGPATSGVSMDYAPGDASQLLVYRNGQLLEEGSASAGDYYYVAPSITGHLFSAKVIFNSAIADDEIIIFELNIL